MRRGFEIMAQGYKNEARSSSGTDQRVCEEPGCDTVLSRYNEFDFCARHQPMVFPRMRGVILD